jgi:hypothetical protein
MLRVRERVVFPARLSPPEFGIIFRQELGRNTLTYLIVDLIAPSTTLRDHHTKGCEDVEDWNKSLHFLQPQKTTYKLRF